MAGPCIAVIGFGFSGLMVVTHAVHALSRDSTVYVIAENLSGLGLAYGTDNPLHLLNVPAARIGAFAEAPEGFFRWLKTGPGALAKQRLGVVAEYNEGDYAPRALYGAYLDTLWQDTQALAQERGVQVKLVESIATRIRPEEEGLAILTARGDAIAVDAAVLATGNETKRIFPEVKSAQVLQQPFAPGAFADAAHWTSPVLLMGAALTAVDSVVSLRAAGYAGEILALSPQGRWPLAHQQPAAAAEDMSALADSKGLQAVLRYFLAQRRKGLDWRALIDGMRPYTQALWSRFTLREQQRFLRRLRGKWNIHRHRMAPTMAALIAAETLRGQLRLVAVSQVKASVEAGRLQVEFTSAQGVETVQPGRAINCTGAELQVAASQNPVLRQALADGVIEPHANGLGIALDPQGRAWGAAHPRVYAIGPLTVGQWLESTAVPEIRVQAEAIVQALCKQFSGG